MIYDRRGRAGRQSPFEERTGEQPGTYPHLRSFGTPAFLKIHTHTSKLQPRGREGVYVGYSPENESHLIYIPPTTLNRGALLESNHLDLDDKRLPRDALTGGPKPVFRHTATEETDAIPADAPTTEEPVQYHLHQAARDLSAQEYTPPDTPTAPPKDLWDNPNPSPPEDYTEPLLQDNWVRAVTDTGTSYYWHRITRQVQWEAPLAVLTPTPTQPDTTSTTLTPSTLTQVSSTHETEPSTLSPHVQSQILPVVPLSRSLHHW